MNLRMGNWTLRALIARLHRHLWLAMTIGGGVFVVFCSLASFLPRLYKSSALLVMEEKGGASDSRRSPHVMSMETRLNAMTHEVLNNARLEKIVKEFGLEDKNSLSLEEAVRRVRNAIEVAVIEEKQERKVTFSVSFSGADPRKVAAITNALASFYVEHKAAREKERGLGSGVAPQQVDEVKQKLDEQEKQIRQYRDRYRQELPEQLEANTKAAERLQNQIPVITKELASKRERRSMLARRTPAEAVAKSRENPTALEVLTQQVSRLQQELSELQSQYKDEHPAVKQKKHELGALEERLKVRLRRAKREGGGGASTDELHELKKLQQQLNEYRQRIENTPKRALGLQLLTHDYNVLLEQYTSLAKSREEVSRPRREHFRLLQPATSSNIPLGPSRFRLFLLAVLLGGGGALGGVVLWERFIDASFHTAVDLEQTTNFPVLAAIPRIVGEREQSPVIREQVTRIASLIFLFVVGGGIVGHYATKNTEFALKFSDAPKTVEH